jgi:hypothetical protein
VNLRRLASPRLVLLALLVSVPVGVATARQFVPVSNSPATGHAQVVTQGIASFSGDEMVWRVVQRTASPRWEAKANRTVLGFVLASDEPVLLTNIVEDNKKKDVAHLNLGESYLVEAGEKQIRASMTDEPVVYLSLEIVRAADAEKVGDGTLLYQSEPFTPPDGQRDVDLVRNILEQNETATLPDTGESVYILATDGAIDILPSTAEEATTLQPGESGIFTGPLEITAVQPSAEGSGQIAAVGLSAGMLQAAEGGASYVVAVIGEEIPPIRTPTPTVTPTPTESEVPTEAPTEEASEEPTEEPTLDSTKEPTDTPTETEVVLVDSDRDGLYDHEEAQYGTDPQNPDSDFDGLNDGDEVRLGTSPTDKDTDDDGLTDGDEVLDCQSGNCDPLNPRLPPRITGGQ